MNDEIKRLLWPLKSQEEIDKHWELFKESRGKS